MSTKALIESIGHEVRLRRRQCNLNQEDLAFKAGVHRNVVSRLERGVYNPSIETLFSISTELGISLAELVGAAERRMREL